MIRLQSEEERRKQDALKNKENETEKNRMTQRVRLEKVLRKMDVIFRFATAEYSRVPAARCPAKIGMACSRNSAQESSRPSRLTDSCKNQNSRLPGRTC